MSCSCKDPSHPALLMLHDCTPQEVATFKGHLRNLPSVSNVNEQSLSFCEKKVIITMKSQRETMNPIRALFKVERTTQSIRKQKNAFEIKRGIITH